MLSQPLGLAVGVSQLPFAALIDAQGILVAKGLVNTREHLESLLQAMHSGYATLQDYVQEHQEHIVAVDDSRPSDLAAEIEPVKEYAP